MTWILYALLSTGEAGPVPVPQSICEQTASAVNDGALVIVDLDNGARVQVVGAACLGPAEADPCHVEVGS
jgi:hypothetical protein